MTTSGICNVNPLTRDMVKIRYLISPIPPRAKDSGNNRREMGIHRGGTKHLQCIASPSRRASQGYLPHQHNRPSNVDAEPRSGGTGKIQCSPYQLEHGGNFAIGTDECDHERHEGSIKYASGGAN